MTTFTGVAVRFLVQAEDGLCVTRKAVEEALPRFFKLGGPVHFGHGRRAIGKVLSAQVTPSALVIKFEVNDPTFAAWAADGTTSALSIGFRFNRRQDVRNNVVHGCDLNEISLTDIPGCPGCRIHFPNH